jgi:hypothetical protein
MQKGAERWNRAQLPRDQGETIEPVRFELRGQTVPLSRGSMRDILFGLELINYPKERFSWRLKSLDHVVLRITWSKERRYLRNEAKRQTLIAQPPMLKLQ